MANFVATLQCDGTTQTFVFPSTATLDEIFEEAAKRQRGLSFGGIAEQLAGKHRVYSLTISRDEASEPARGFAFDSEGDAEAG